MVEYNKQINIGDANRPTLEQSPEDPTKVQAIFFDQDHKRYYFSNDQGHKVIEQNLVRPMTKKEYISGFQQMLTDTLAEPTTEPILDELLKLDFGIGHANSTFEVTRPCLSVGTEVVQIFNKGTSRFIYNIANDTVYHINRSKNINGLFLPDGPEKEQVIKILTTSKTMQAKM